jgi:hypothetical protein
MECNIGQDAIFFTHSELLYFLGIFIKGRLVKISENIAFLFYKEIYMKYLILYYKTEILLSTINQTKPNHQSNCL